MKVLAPPLVLSDLWRDDKSLQQAIHRRYYEMSVDVLEAALLEFTPTSVHRNWLGKYRCMWCTRTGYVWETALEDRYWWGHRHGKNCAKRP